jgi:hypothetical protein
LARYWWFASEIRKADIRYNLDWLKDHGFGGVELAWVYPLNAMDTTLDQEYTPRPEWLGPEWRKMVEYAMRYADSIGLVCDLTMGTLWPFGDSHVPYEHAARVYGSHDRQTITRSWEHPKTGYVVDHLNPDHYMPYFERVYDSFPHPQIRLRPAYFIDSWEVEVRNIWTDGFREAFLQRFGYDVSNYMNDLYLPQNRDRLYDYMKLVSEKTLRFYRHFDAFLNERNVASRGQCSGAPCDIISAYAVLDVPEGEAMLYEPEYNAIPASAAVLSGKKTVTAESFTCLYGWPRQHIREEQTADLKMVADALFANGINHIIWHGKPHNPAGIDSISFYASVHVGGNGALAKELKAFNRYLSSVSALMKKGTPHTDIAVYLPTEDAWMKGIMPKEKQFIWAWGFYEIRYVYFPEELAGYHPTWINKEFLGKGLIKNGRLVVGDASFQALYLDVAYLDYEALVSIVRLAEQGFPVIIRQSAREAGFQKHADWDALWSDLTGLENVYQNVPCHVKPLLTGDAIPPFRARLHGDTLLVFFAHPNSERLTFPIGYGQSFTRDSKHISIHLKYQDQQFDLDLQFDPYQSLMYRFFDGRMEPVPIDFRPETPVVKPPLPDAKKPWRVR